MKKLALLLLVPLSVPLFLSAEFDKDATVRSLILLFQMNREKVSKETAELKEEIQTLASENRRLIIEWEDAKHQTDNKELALKAAQARIQTLEEQVELLKRNPLRKQVKDIEVLAMALPSDLESFGPDFSKPNANDSNPLNEPYTGGTVLLVNINTATEREIRMIPGVGGALAKRIIENRPYDSVWALRKLDGMGKKRVETLQVYMTVE